MENKFWFPVPVKALRVIVGIAQEQTLDLLCETILKLLRIRACSAEDIEKKIKMKPDLVMSAIAELENENLIKKNIGNSYVATDTQLKFAGRELKSGWAFYCPHDNEFLPRIWIGKLPYQFFDVEDYQKRWKDSFVLIEKDQIPSVQLPKTPDVVTKLKRLAVNPELVVRYSKEVNKKPAPGSKLDLVDFPNIDFDGACETAISSITLDSSVHIYHRGSKQTQVWGMVEFLPGFDGNVTSVFRRPEVLPGAYLSILKLKKRQANDSRLEVWIEKEWEAMHRELNSKKELAKENNSVVLKRANLDEEKFSRLRKEHWDEQLMRNGTNSFVQSARSLEEQVKHCQSKLIIWKSYTTAETYRDACYAYEHAIEELGKSMRSPLIDQILEFGKRFKAMDKSEQQDYCETRFGKGPLRVKLDSLQLYDKVGKSFSHIYGSVKTVKQVENTNQRLKKNNLGAGESIIIWLLPLVLFEKEEISSHAEKVRSAYDAVPGLANELEVLIEFRNAIAHNRKEGKEEQTLGLIELDDLLFKVACAMFGNRNPPVGRGV